MEENAKSPYVAIRLARGAIAALTLAALILQPYDTERYLVLREFHSVIVGWDYICGRLVAAALLLFPDLHLSNGQMNFVLFVALVWLPCFFVLYDAINYKTNQNCLKNTLNRYSIILIFVVIVFCFLSFFYYMYNSIEIYFSKYFYYISIFPIVICISELPLYRRGFIFVVVIVTAFEFMHFLNVPTLSKWIDQI